MYEYSRAITVALLIWTDGVAKGSIKHGVDNGLDALRKLYHRHVPLAGDMQNTLTCELVSLKAGAEADTDTLFGEAERIRYMYSK